jgi:hypothetical protein
MSTITPTQLARQTARAERYRRELGEARRELKHARKEAFAQGSAATLLNVYRVLGDAGAVELSAKLISSRGRKSMSSPELEAMMVRANNELSK